MSNHKKILCIGAAHFDRIVFLKEDVTLGQSNPVSSFYVMGGVGFNMAAYFRYKEIETGLISYWGQDFEVRKIYDELADLSIDYQASKNLRESSTASYTAIHKPNGDLIIGIADIDVYECPKVEEFEEMADYLAEWDAIVVDSNFPTKVIEVIARLKQPHQRLYGVTVSPAKAHRFDDALSYFDALFVNQQELEALSKKDVSTRSEIQKVAQVFIQKGVKDMFITMGPEGVYHASETEFVLYDAPDANVKNVTGAGDAFSAAVIASLVAEKEIEPAILDGLAAAKMILESEKASNLATLLKHLREEHDTPISPASS